MTNVTQVSEALQNLSNRGGYPPGVSAGLASPRSLMINNMNHNVGRRGPVPCEADKVDHLRWRWISWLSLKTINPSLFLLMDVYPSIFSCELMDAHCSGQFTCNDGECIHIEQRFAFVNSTLHPYHSYLLLFRFPTQWSFLSVAVFVIGRCDQTSNCFDQSDEDNCKLIFMKALYIFLYCFPPLICM